MLVWRLICDGKSCIWRFPDWGRASWGVISNVLELLYWSEAKQCSRHVRDEVNRILPRNHRGQMQNVKMPLNCTTNCSEPKSNETTYWQKLKHSTIPKENYLHYILSACYSPTYTYSIKCRWTETKAMLISVCYIRWGPFRATSKWKIYP